MAIRLASSLATLITIAAAISGCAGGLDTGADPEDSAQVESGDEPVALAAGSDGALTVVNNNYPKYVSLVETPVGSGQFRAEINLRPSGELPAGSVMFSVNGEGTVAGWSLNIGDSPTNDGYGGDSASNSNDAELQILNNTLSVYASDYGQSKLIRSEPGIVPTTSSRNIRFKISNNKVEYWKNKDQSTKKTVTNSNLFAFDGRNDAEGPEDYKLYLGINRVIGGTARTGTGIRLVDIYLEDFDIKNVTWVLSKAILPDNSTFLPEQPGQYTLEYASDGTFTGDDNCNWMFGKYRLTGDGMSITNVAETKVGCSLEGMPSFLAYLKSATTYSATDRQLSIRFNNTNSSAFPLGSGTFYFKKGA